MLLDIPDDIVKKAESSGIDLHIALAVQFYADNRIDHADACRLAGLSAAAFNAELLSRAISVQQCPRASRTRRTAG